MKDDIEQKMLNSAIELFSSQPYDQVSVLQIVNHAGVSNGVFYNYFTNKQDIFTALVATLLEKFENQFEKIEGTNIEKRLRHFIELKIELVQNEYKMIRLFREAQYTFIEYEFAIRDLYIKALKKVYRREITEYHYIIVMAAIRYTTIVYFNIGKKIDVDFLVKFLLNGFEVKSTVEIKSIVEEENFILKIPLNLSKRLLIMRKAMELFGKMGYFNVKIEDITQALSLSVGTFYQHFKNKDELLGSILDLIDAQIEQIVNENIFKTDDMCYKYLKTLYLLQSYFGISPDRYRIIRDAEFLFENFSSRYESIEKHFLMPLEESGYTEEERHLIANIFQGMSHYIGIDTFYTKLIKNPEILLKKILSFMESGSKTKI